MVENRDWQLKHLLYFLYYLYCVYQLCIQVRIHTLLSVII